MKAADFPIRGPLLLRSENGQRGGRGELPERERDTFPNGLNGTAPFPNGTIGGLIRPSIFLATPHIVAGFTTRAHGCMRMSQPGAPMCPPYQSIVREFWGGGEGDRGETGEMTAKGGTCSVGWALPTLVHGAEVMWAESAGRYGECDGLVTGTKNLILSVTAADCGSVLLADEEAGLVGACHAGWRGVRSGIALNTVRAMLARGAQAERMRAYVGPCISLESLEVGEEVAEQFLGEFIQWQSDWVRPHLDLKGAIVAQLHEGGLEHIEVSEECTVLNSDRFFSHRKSGGEPSRMMAFIAIKGS